MAGDWYKTWFDTPFYHLMYQHRNECEAEHFLNNLLGYLKPTSQASFLDVGCGKGRHAVYLNSRGYTVTGIDLSAQSIQSALQWENAKLSFFIHDMRNTLCINCFDYVFNLFTSFGYFESERENDHAIRTMAQALKPGGVLVLDFLNSHLIKNLYFSPEQCTREDVEFSVTKKIADGWIVKNIEVLYQGKRAHFEERVRLLEYADFEKYFLKNGLAIEKVVGDYDLNPFLKEKSNRLILLARKN